MPFEEKRIQQVQEREHCFEMENRENVRVTGVEDVESFSDEVVVLVTYMGKLTVKGSNLRINKLNVDNGELTMAGRVNALEYSVNNGNDGGFFARLFK
jgi:sporulation protein YabP